MPVNYETPFEVRDTRNGSWFWVHTHIWFDKRLTKTDKHVYATLAIYANSATQESFPSITTLAKDCEISKRHTYRSLRNLENSNYLKIERLKGKVNRYYLLKTMPSMSPVTPMSPGSDTHVTTTGDMGAPRTRIIEPELINKNSPKGLQKTGEYGNPQVNQLLEEFQRQMDLSVLDGSEKENRRYAWLLLKKAKSLTAALELVKLAAHDEWYGKNTTSLKSLYYNAVKIANRRRGGVNDSKRAVDARGIR